MRSRRAVGLARRRRQPPHAAGLEIVDAADELDFTCALQVAQQRTELADARQRQLHVRLVDGFRDVDLVAADVEAAALAAVGAAGLRLGS